MKSSPYAAQVSAYLDVTFYENIFSFPLLPPHNKLAWRRHKAGLEFSFYFEFTMGWVWMGVVLVNIKRQISDICILTASTVVKMINILIFQYWILLGGKF